ncbi:MAG: peptidoglycan DD-metalloendopeptidase family protein [Candidatus Pacebacteria bacterium]|nr:peptidoglycan DD-metalloendopeptidase family protein [Candidatus Paceibacterota bacterium]
MILAAAMTICFNGSGKTIVADQTNLINIESSLQPVTSIITGENKVLAAISSPLFISSQTLGSIFGDEKDNSIIKYTVKRGETINQIAEDFGISAETILLANELSSSTVREGDELMILPVDGLLHMVESGETIERIAKKYSADSGQIIDFNRLSDEGEVFVGDILIVPEGRMPKPAQSTAPVAQVSLPDSYFISPATGIITQGAHFSHIVNGYRQYNAADIANTLGTPIVAVAGGTIQIVKTVWPYGNYITILHPNGVVTLYGHLNSFAKDTYSGKQVSQGEIIGYMGSTGYSTGSHLHFEVRGAANPLLKYRVGTRIVY